MEDKKTQASFLSQVKVSYEDQQTLTTEKIVKEMS